MCTPPTEEVKGQVLITRVCEHTIYKKASSHQHLHTDFLINKNLKRGVWKTILIDNGHIGTDDILTAIGEMYDLDQGIQDRFFYHTLNTTAKKKIQKKIERNDNNIYLLEGREIVGNGSIERDIHIDDLTLYVGMRKGDKKSK